ncbi:Vesicle transport protein SFT2B, partial [Dermatophagoides pteronyssinus]
HKSLFPEISFYTRIKLFLGCLILSLLLTILSWTMILLSLKTFATFYTFSTVLCLFSIMFLVGPMEQLKSILTITRLISSSILLLSIFLTLLSALKWKQGILAITFSTIQFLSFIYYALSYLPYAQTIFKHFFQTTCTTCCC